MASRNVERARFLLAFLDILRRQKNLENVFSRARLTFGLNFSEFLRFAGTRRMLNGKWVKYYAAVVKIYELEVRILEMNKLISRVYDKLNFLVPQISNFSLTFPPHPPLKGESSSI